MSDVSSSITMGADRTAGNPRSGRSPAIARKGMVASSQPLAVQAGLKVLRDGGNAFDAAVAVSAVLSVVEPMMTGPGGDMFAIGWVGREKELFGINASGHAPAEVGPDFFTRRNLDEIPLQGAFAVTVPGAVDGWAKLLEGYGTLTLAQTLQPAITYAEEGFPVSQVVAADWSRHGEPFFADPDFQTSYAPHGRAPRHGDVMINPGLGDTLRRIAAHGREEFYRGETAQRIVQHLNRLDWPISMEDMAAQEARWVQPLSITYRDATVYELPPNGQGVAALEMLNILEGFALSELGHNSVDYIHLLVEAKKLAFADLAAWLADPDKSQLPTDEMISKEYAARQRQRINPSKAAADVRSGIAPDRRGLTEKGDTVYLTVVDRDRNCCSFINSIFHGFGSGVVVPRTGILLQNRGALFSLDPAHPNCIAPHKRPFHTIIPAMAFREGKPWLSFGVMGGDMQPQGHVQVLLNRMEFGLNVQEAGEAARCRHDPENGVALESAIGSDVREGLRQRGHALSGEPAGFGGYQAIEIDWDRGVLMGGSDPRKDGLAAGW